jgi:hypothetical protein
MQRLRKVVTGEIIAAAFKAGDSKPNAAAVSNTIIANIISDWS